MKCCPSLCSTPLTSQQALENGVEFLLIFNSGSFSEDNTFLVSELFERTPKEVLAKNFRTDVSSFDNLPDGQLYIFPGTPAPADINEQKIVGPNGVVPISNTFSYHWSQVQPYDVPGGSIKILDPVNFPAASPFSVALVTVHPGAMREMHWHTKSDEWSYFIAGQARITVFSAPSASRTFDFTAGDVGYVPVADAHYIENTGDTDVIFLEVLLQDQFTDISVGQWLGLTPKQVVKDHLHLPDDVINNLPTDKPFLAAGLGFNNTRTNFTGAPQ
jgi:oxalate decarboxylase family bicupin protein